MRSVNLKLDVRRVQMVAEQSRPFLPMLSRHEAETVVKFKALIEPFDKSGGLRLEKKGTDAELCIYEPIGLDWWTGDGMTPYKLKEQLAALRPFNKLAVKINSGGGDAFDGVTIFNVLRMLEEEVRVEIEGMAASAASVIAQSADPGLLRIHEAGFAMVHNAATGLFIFANKHVLREETDKLYDVLDKVDNVAADLYTARSGRPRGDWVDFMDRETYFTGKEAVEEKFADELISLSRETSQAASSKPAATMKRRDYELRLRSA